ncbi:hypothetical protein PG989_016181 [Apiospora arundinis]
MPSLSEHFQFGENWSVRTSKNETTTPTPIKNTFSPSSLVNSAPSQTTTLRNLTQAVAGSQQSLSQNHTKRYNKPYLDDETAEDASDKMAGEKSVSSSKGGSSSKAKDSTQSSGTQTDKKKKTGYSSDSDGENTAMTQLEAQVLASVTQLMTAEIRDQMPHDAARLEIDKYIEEVNAETEEEKVNCLVKRIDELSMDTLERVFLQRSVIEKLKRLVAKGETEMSLLEWEKL